MLTSPSPLLPDYDIHAWRARIPILASAIPMNNCSHSPQTDITRAAAEEYLDWWNRVGMDWEAWMEIVSDAKREFAALIGASPDEIAVASCVSEATSAFASALDFRGPRRAIVASEAEFPTVGHVWLAQERLGAAVRWVPMRDGVLLPDDYARAIGDDTLLLAATHGAYQSGFKQDVSVLARIAHERGALCFVDAYQTLGTCPIDVKALGVDVLVGGVLKYLMGVPGVAFLYVRRELIDALHPTLTGWFGRANPYAFDAQRLDWSPTASRFDTGTPPIVNAAIARAGLGIIRDVGPARIERWTERLVRRLIEGGDARGLTLLGTRDVTQRTPNTAFVVGDDAHGAETRLRARGVIASARGTAIRLAPHFYTTLDDCDAALDALAACR
jgi:selenocysteine lyase/cysteine desulfurase